jgi:hypothetical protein
VAKAPKNWLLGKHLNSLQVFYGVRAADGTMTWTSAGYLAGNSAPGSCDYVRLADDRALEQINAVDDDHAHYEKTLYDSSFVVGEILKRTGNILPLIANTYDYVKVVFTRGVPSGTGMQTYTYEGIIRGFNDGVVAMGKNSCEITLNQITVNASNGPVLYAVTS